MFPTLDGAYPIVGHLPEMYRGFHALCRRGEARHGPMFWLAGGPGARQLMCTDVSALDALRDPAASTAYYAEGFGALLSNTLFAFDGRPHRRIRSMMGPAFSPARIRKTDVLDIVVDVTRRHIGRWAVPGGKPLPVLSATKDVALEIIFRIIGVPTTEVGAWRRQFARYLLAGFPNESRFRGPMHWVATRAKNWIDARLFAQIERLRREGDDGTLLGAIAHNQSDTGDLLEAELIVPNLRLLVLAGHETTAAALAWNMLHLARSSEHQQRAIDEIGETDALIDLGTHPTQITFAEKQFREALRLYPAVHSVIRRAEHDLTIDAGTIPARSLVNVPLLHLLRNAEAFAEPDAYRPDRWIDRPRPGSLQTAMFGGGPHFCLGYHIAIAEGTLFNLQLARALASRKVRMRPASADPLPAPIYLPLSHPPRTAAVRFERS